MRVRGLGGKPVAISPLASGLTYKVFAKVSNSLDLLKFVEKFGLLEHVENPQSEIVSAQNLRPIKGRPVLRGEDVTEHLETARRFRELLDLITRGGRASKVLAAWLEQVMFDQESLGEVYLAYDRSRSFRPVFRPSSLMNGMLWQLATAVSGQTKFRTCEFCGTLFEVGPKVGRRADAKYCSNEHQILHNSRSRSAPRPSRPR
ncbi:hypothetical protein AB4853_15475 [Bradyrhizobium sp. 1050_B9_N1_2]|uniref:hypothetical protein n=1 Tax=Bradyrhizobium sp. 1050_B9_N1_2 TaxID=3238688 RepID=UPI003EDC2AD5